MSNTPSSLREQKKEETRRALARAAAELLLSEGSDGMTVAAIAGRAGVSTRTFHNYFPRREDALLTFIEHTLGEWRAQVEQSPDGEHPLDTMHRIIAGRLGAGPDAGPEDPTDPLDPGSLLNLMSIGDHLRMTTGPADKQRVLHLTDGLLETLYRRPGHSLTRQAMSLLMFSSLAAGAIAVEADHRAAARGDGGQVRRPWLSRGAGDDRSSAEVLDEGFDLLRSGFSE
ncbi:TetR/AcrR family transcriptional regulator [Corynebacterium terpenotabidum]|uniref:TetR family transcriptional regulator n=1 Tax=Corynebacterium terpenotabidum Y-11 TaxID=1200352 RepID=S4XFE2_9CORY|nr:TetR/AcrR family transcriptional regulator [Corynebacterium terpenotabidum]AGP31271.1 TetR family transcriptional regulator [Corynebacterium terpenotabidum Y-11]